MNEAIHENPITYNELYEKLKKIIKNNDELEVINNAYAFALTKHHGQKRLNGDDFITHPLEVANILCDLNVDYITFACALLHETINHSDTTVDELKEEFNEEISSIVLSISRINRLELTDDKDSSAAYLRKVLVGLSEDVRVLFIKLADRLHNMRTLYALSKEQQLQKANETINVLIPIAHRLGINSLKSELEDLCLRYTKPDVYNDILEKLDASKEELNDLLLEMKDSISNILMENGIKFKIKGRVKSVHSIYNKMDNGKRWNEIYDILALRVFVDTEQDCYLTIGLIHSKFRPMPKRFKDYIANPKENMYQSLHTTVFGIDGQLFEIQVRTYEMDEIAEKGIASHWSYKEKGAVKIQSMMEHKLEMFRNIIDANNKGISSDTEFANNLSDELLSELIYCYTPKGDVLELPKGATPIDFAYRIHSNVGDRAIGAIVNDQIVPLNYSLHDGDIVKINTGKEANPHQEWLKSVKTSQAKNKIKSFFSKKDRANYIELGKELLEKEIRKRKLPFNEVLSEENLQKIIKDTHTSDIEDLYLSIGSLRFTASYIIDLIYADKKDVVDIYLGKMHHESTNNKTLKGDILVAGSDDILVTIANCCKPIKGDPIVGYISKGQGIIVHKSDCHNIQNSNRLINVSWNMINNSAYLTDLYICATKGKNQLLDIITKASQKNIYIETIKTNESEATIKYVLTVKASNVTELENFINDLKSLPFIVEIERV